MAEHSAPTNGPQTWSPRLILNVAGTVARNIHSWSFRGPPWASEGRLTFCLTQGPPPTAAEHKVPTNAPHKWSPGLILNATRTVARNSRFHSVPWAA